MTEWHYAEKGLRKGPVPKEKIQELLSEGLLDNESKLWKEGMADWLSLKDTEFKVNIVTPPPLYGESVSNTIVWILAFAPIIGTFLEFIYAGTQYDNSIDVHYAVTNGDYFYISLGLNVALCVMDETMLRLAGHKTKKLTWWIWLVPVYLFQRAKVTKTGLGYFWTWIGMMAVAALITFGVI